MRAEKIPPPQTSEIGLGITGSTSLITFARWISRIFSPPIMILTLIVLVSYRIGSLSGWLWSGFFVLFGIITPSLYIHHGVKRGVFKDFGLRNRESRIRPLALILTLSLVCTLVIWARSGPDELIYLAGTGVIFLAVILLITLRWKISGHTTAAACWTALMLGMLGTPALPTLGIPLLVAWSRVYLARHDQYQTIGGMFLGAGGGLLYLFLLSLP